jgi:hypothetical protein
MLFDANRLGAMERRAPPGPTQSGERRQQLQKLKLDLFLQVGTNVFCGGRPHGPVVIGHRRSKQADAP